jgi:hypothetical protein
MRETTINETLNSAVEGQETSESHAPRQHSIFAIRSRSISAAFERVVCWSAVLSVLACPAQRQNVADKVYGLEVANGSARWRPGSAILGPSILARHDCRWSRHICHAGVGGSASASELLGYQVRAQAAQAAPNIWLESLHLGTLRGNQSKFSGRSLARL